MKFFFTNFFIHKGKFLNSPRKTFTYSIKNSNLKPDQYSKYLNNAFVEKTIEKALNLWFEKLNSSISIKKLKLTGNYKKIKMPDVIFSFSTGKHGDTFLFDGLNGELAHYTSYIPFKSSLLKEIHLDDDEDWKNGISLF